MAVPLSSRIARTWRGLVAAALATFVAAVSHAAAQGEAAPLLGALLAFALAAPVCVLLAGRRLSWTRLSIAVAASQFAFHGLLAIGVGEGTDAALTPVSGHVLHSGVLAAPAHTVMAHTTMAHGGGMWWAHAIAAIVTVVALGKGETALRTLLQLLRRRLAVPRTVVLPAPVLRSRPATRMVVDTGCAILSVVSRRGPPLAA